MGALIKWWEAQLAAWRLRQAFKETEKNLGGSDIG